MITQTIYLNPLHIEGNEFAAKITTGARNIKLNVSRTIYETISIVELWERCKSPPQIQHP